MHTDTQMKNSYDLSTTLRDHFQKLPGFYIPSTQRDLSALIMEFLI